MFMRTFAIWERKRVILVLLLLLYLVSLLVGILHLFDGLSQAGILSGYYTVVRFMLGESIGAPPKLISILAKLVTDAQPISPRDQNPFSRLLAHVLKSHNLGSRSDTYRSRDMFAPALAPHPAC